MVKRFKVWAARNPVMVCVGCVMLLALIIRFMPNTNSDDRAKTGANPTTTLASSQLVAKDVIDSRTRCSNAVAIINGSDRPKLSAVDAYVTAVMREEDQKRIANGEHAMLPQLDRTGFVRLRTMAIEFCRDKPASTLHDAAADAYDGLRTMKTDLGGQW